MRSNFFDPASDGFDLADFLLLGGGAALVAFWGFVRRWVVLPIRRSAKDALVTQIRLVVRDELATATLPIQPHANGGKSLPDVAVMTAYLADAVAALAAAQGVELPDRPSKEKP